MDPVFSGSQIIGGFLADRIGRKHTMLVGLTSTAAALLLLPWSYSPWLLAAEIGVVGSTGDMHRPADYAFVCDLVPEDLRIRAYACLSWASNLGMPMAMLIASVVVSHSYTPLFVIDSITCLAFALLIALRLRVPRGDAQPAGRKEAVRAAKVPNRGHPWSDIQLLFVAVSSACMFTVIMQSVVILPVHTQAYGLSTSDYGFPIAVNGIGMALVQPLADRWLGSQQPLSVLAASYLVIGLGMGATGLVDSLTGFAAIVVIWSLGEVAMSAVGPAVVSRLAPTDARGRYMGIYGSAVGTSFVLAPVAGTALYHVASGALWGGCLVLGVTFAVIQLSVAGRMKHRLLAAPPGG